MTVTVAEDVAVLGAAWRSIGLRGAAVEWELAQPARLTGSLAMRLRSALGPALVMTGVRSTTLQCIPGDSRPAALWFLGWDCPPAPVRRLRADLRCVGAVAADWPELSLALARLRLPAARSPGALSEAVGFSIAWQGGRAAGYPGFGPPLVADPELESGGGSCLVEAVTPLQLRASGRVVDTPPPLSVLVRSAGERLRQLCLHWGCGAEALPPIIGRACREACGARLAWARPTGSPEVARRSSSTGQVQRIRGLVGLFAYEDVTPLAMSVMALAAEIGVGKDTSFGCGQVRVYRGLTR